MAHVIAHRAGNDLSCLREAQSLGIGVVEADVRLWRGRLEVRHLKTLGPLPLLWDRWELASRWAPRLGLRELLDALGERTELLLDLKGRNPRLAELVLLELPANVLITVCARSWRLLDPFRELDNVRLVYSIGSRRALRRLLRKPPRLRLDGFSVHERLLDDATVVALRGIAGLVLSWPVNTAQRARELAAAGVDGLISDNLHLAT